MKTKTTRVLITMAAIAVAAVAVYVYATQHVAGLTKETATLRDDIAYKEITYKNADNLQKAVQSAADQKTKIAGYFLPADGAIDFISSLEKTASNFGLSYSTQNITEESTDDLASQNKELLHIVFSAQGSWPRVMRLMKAVETLPYGMRVDKIDLDASGGASVADASSTKSARMWTANVLFSIVKTKDNAK